jgi:hypothetical protein
VVVILTRRCIKPNKEAEFLADYRSHTPDHPGFIGQTLTKLQNSGDLPEPMRSLHFGCGNCVVYLNIARMAIGSRFPGALQAGRHARPALRVLGSAPRRRRDRGSRRGQDLMEIAGSVAFMHSASEVSALGQTRSCW